MWWLRPLPVVRWTLAAAIIASAFIAEVSEPASRRYPFAARDLPAGASIVDIDIDWRDVPGDSLPIADLRGRLAVDVAAGTPMVPALFVAEPLVPDGWWIVDLALSDAARPGTQVRIVIVDPPTSVTGIVAASSRDDPLGGPRRGAVAVPESVADLVARAAAADRVITLIEPSTGRVPDD